MRLKFASLVGVYFAVCVSVFALTLILTDDVSVFLILISMLFVASSALGHFVGAREASVESPVTVDE